MFPAVFSYLRLFLGVFPLFFAVLRSSSFGHFTRTSVRQSKWYDQEKNRKSIVCYDKSKNRKRQKPMFDKTPKFVSLSACGLFLVAGRPNGQSGRNGKTKLARHFFGRSGVRQFETHRTFRNIKNEKTRKTDGNSLPRKALPLLANEERNICNRGQPESRKGERQPGWTPLRQDSYSVFFRNQAIFRKKPKQC